MGKPVPSVTTYDAQPQLRDLRRFVREAWRDLAHGASLAPALFRASLRTTGRRALLGHLWLVIPAAAAAIAVNYVQSARLLVVPDAGMPLPVFVFAGMALWQLFVEALNAPGRQLLANRSTVTRLRVPHEGLVLAGACEVVLNAAVRFLALLALCLALGVPLGAAAALFPLAALALAALGLGVGLLLAPLTLLFEDGARGLLLATNLLVFVVPVLYPIPAAGWQGYNILIPLIDTPRNLLVGLPVPGSFAGTAGLAVALLIAAWPVYRLTRLHLMARLG